MMKATKIISAIALTCTPLFAFAEGSEKSISYSYIDLGFQQAKVTDGEDIKADGPRIVGSFEVASNVFVKVGYRSLETENLYLIDSGTLYRGTLELSNLAVGIGGYYPIKENIHFVGELNVSRGEVKGKGGFSWIEKESDTGWNVGLGIRAMATNWLELSTGLVHGEIYDESETGFVLGARAHFSKVFSLGLDFVKYSDEDQLGVSARFSF